MDNVKVERLIVEFSGWMQCEPEETKFQYIGTEQYASGEITGNEYMALTPEKQGDYVLQCLGKTYIHALDVGLEHCDVEIDEV